jgi:hypothetical protein
VAKNEGMIAGDGLAAQFGQGFDLKSYYTSRKSALTNKSDVYKNAFLDSISDTNPLLEAAATTLEMSEELGNIEFTNYLQDLLSNGDETTIRAVGSIVSDPHKMGELETSLATSLEKGKEKFNEWLETALNESAKASAANAFSSNKLSNEYSSNVYVALLKKKNPALDDQMANRIAENTAKLYGGFTTLNKAWKENSDILLDAEASEIEYANALAGVSASF